MKLFLCVSFVAVFIQASSGQDLPDLDFEKIDINASFDITKSKVKPPIGEIKKIPESSYEKIFGSLVPKNEVSFYLSDYAIYAKEKDSYYRIISWGNLGADSTQSIGYFFDGIRNQTQAYDLIYLINSRNNIIKSETFFYEYTVLIEKVNKKLLPNSLEYLPFIAKPIFIRGTQYYYVQQTLLTGYFVKHKIYLLDDTGHITSIINGIERHLEIVMPSGTALPSNFATELSQIKTLAITNTFKKEGKHEIFYPSLTFDMIIDE